MQMVDERPKIWEIHYRCTFDQCLQTLKDTISLNPKKSSGIVTIMARLAMILSCIRLGANACR
jgi:hypothetical protein